MEMIKAKEYWGYVSQLPDINQNDDIEIYTNVWGEMVVRYRGVEHIVKPNLQKKINHISEGGHAIPGGFFNIDEDGNEVFGSEDFDEYMRIEKQMKLKQIVKDFFKKEEFSLEEDPNNTVTIDDVQIVHNCYWNAPYEAGDVEKVATDIIEKVQNYLHLGSDAFYHDISTLEKCIINAVTNLDVSYLKELEEGILYSHSFKDELIIEFAMLFKKLLLKGVTSLMVKPSKCLYCYPNANAFSFHHPETYEFICRYVIGKDEKGYSKFIVEECRNKPLKFEDVFPGI